MNRNRLFKVVLLYLNLNVVQSAAPTVSIESYDLQYSYYTKFQSLINTEDKPIHVSSLIALNDADSTNLIQATIEISSGYTSGDTLIFEDQNSITGTFNSASGVLLLTGSASIDDYKTALRSLTFLSSPDHEFTDQGNTHSKTLRFQVIDDSAESSNQATRNIILTTPKLVYTDTHQGKIVRVIA